MYCKKLRFTTEAIIILVDEVCNISLNPHRSIKFRFSLDNSYYYLFRFLQFDDKSVIRL